jgi:hypothetical protein
MCATERNGGVKRSTKPLSQGVDRPRAVTFGEHRQNPHTKKAANHVPHRNLKATLTKAL